jgi:hypothetical protein
MDYLWHDMKAVANIPQGGRVELNRWVVIGTVRVVRVRKSDRWFQTQELTRDSDPELGLAICTL